MLFWTFFQRSLICLTSWAFVIMFCDSLYIHFLDFLPLTKNVRVNIFRLLLCAVVGFFFYKNQTHKCLKIKHKRTTTTAEKLPISIVVLKRGYCNILIEGIIYHIKDLLHHKLGIRCHFISFFQRSNIDFISFTYCIIMSVNIKTVF